MLTHHQLGHLRVARAQGAQQVLMLLEGLPTALATHAKLHPVHPQQVIEVFAQERDQLPVLAALHDPEMEIQIALLLEIGLPLLLLDLLAMLREQAPRALISSSVMASAANRAAMPSSASRK